MADFVAVIRRAVDGLASNTPEMRVRVYEKARGAVQRQLENMKPRPSDEMLRRQLDKLDAAIAAVEAEHAEALPPLDEPAAVAVADVYDAPESDPAPDERYEGVPEAAGPAEASEYPAEEDRSSAIEPAEPVDEAPRDMDTAPDAPVYAPEPVNDDQTRYEDGGYTEPETAEPPFHDVTDATDAEREPPVAAEDPWQPQAPESVFAETPHHDPEPAQDSGYDTSGVVDQPGNEQATFAPEQDGPAEQHDEDQPEPDVLSGVDAPRVTTSQAAPAWPDAPSTAPVISNDPFADDEARPAGEAADGYGQDRDDWYMPSADIDHAGQAPTQAAQMAHDDWALSANDSRAYDEPAVVTEGTDEADRNRSSFDDAAAADLFTAHFDEEQHAEANARMPAVSDLPDFSAAALGAGAGVAVAASAMSDDRHTPSTDRRDGDLLDDYPHAPQPTARIAPAPAAADDPWNDLEELIGYDRNAAAAGAASGSGTPGASANAVDPQEDSAELEALMAAPTATRAYRVTPKPKRNYAAILLAIVGLLLLAGGGYAIWMNRDALNEVVGQVTAPSSSETVSAPASDASAPTNTAVSPDAAQPPAQAPAATPAQPTPATGGDAAGTTKFTQRLLPNGTEVDEGAGGPSAGVAGQSVAELNAPPAEGAATPPAAAANEAAPAQTPPANPADAAAVSGQKIFLYEERIGQSSPTAVEGTVAWSLQKENGENGRPESSVQGRITIPGRGMTALVTFKRNTDSSLPASHLVEFVFSLPKDFEGGAIDSVQRISMKQTEQDRGDALIAVPAKITPDFHMIALNDFADARARNLELLRTRNWIDVPLIYNTGRRALLTLQKGPEGTQAFEEATREWQALSQSQGQ